MGSKDSESTPAYGHEFIRRLRPLGRTSETYLWVTIARSTVQGEARKGAEAEILGKS